MRVSPCPTNPNNTPPVLRSGDWSQPPTLSALKQQHTQGQRTAEGRESVTGTHRPCVSGPERLSESHSSPSSLRLSTILQMPPESQGHGGQHVLSMENSIAEGSELRQEVSNPDPLADPGDTQAPICWVCPGSLSRVAVTLDLGSEAVLP